MNADDKNVKVRIDHRTTGRARGIGRLTPLTRMSEFDTGHARGIRRLTPLMRKFATGHARGIRGLTPLMSVFTRDGLRRLAVGSMVLE